MAVSRKTVTVLFADVADSTGLGERLDPESVRSALGRWFEAAREVMRRSDSGAPLGALGEAMLEATHAAGTTELVGALHALSEPGEWAALAGVVFDTAAKDPAADSLVERAAAGLGELVAVVRRRLALEGPVVLAGGQLLNQPRLEAAVRKQVGAAVRLEEPPVAGAVRLAELSLS